MQEGNAVVAAHIILNHPALPEVLDMRIVVPGKEDAKRRIGIYARVIALAYSRDYEKCSWCTEPIEGGRIFHSVEDGLHVYCSTSCLIASL